MIHLNINMQIAAVCSRSINFRLHNIDFGVEINSVIYTLKKILTLIMQCFEFEFQE